LKESAIGWPTDEFLSDANGPDQAAEVRIPGAERHRPADPMGAVISRPNEALIAECYPDVEVRGDLGENDMLQAFLLGPVRVDRASSRCQEAGSSMSHHAAPLG
jgi:hypothetical protein